MKPLQVFGLIVVIVAVIVSVCVINLRPVIFTCTDVKVTNAPIEGRSANEIQALFLGSTIKTDLYENSLNLFVKRQYYDYWVGTPLNKVSDNKYRAQEYDMWNVSYNTDCTLEFTTDHGVIVSAQMIIKTDKNRSVELTLKRKSAVASFYHFMFEHLFLAGVILALIGFALFE